MDTRMIHHQVKGLPKCPSCGHQPENAATVGSDDVEILTRKGTPTVCSACGSIGEVLENATIGFMSVDRFRALPPQVQFMMLDASTKAAKNMPTPTTNEVGNA